MQTQMGPSIQVSLLTALLLDAGTTFGDATAAAAAGEANDELTILGAESTLTQLSR